MNSQESNNMEINKHIIDLLTINPGLKAREIATRLNVDKKIVNEALYGYLKNICVQDDNYCWYTIKDAPKEKIDIEIKKSNTVLSNICHYYLECLSHDYEDGINVFADSKFDLDYVELDSLPDLNQENLFNSVEAKNLFNNTRKSRSKKEMYFAYPTTLKKIYSKKSNWEGMLVEPILLFPIDTDSGSPKLSQQFPVFNLSVLKRFTKTEREQLMDELMQLENELNLNSENEMPEIDDLVKKLNIIRPEWPWKENINPDDLNTNPPLKTIKEEGIYNRAILITAERSPYTKGLETELKSLSELPKDTYQNTALGHWIDNNILKNEEKENTPLLEVLPLNTEQRQAILNSLHNSLTVITGPPGTGKSQVVTNLIINATWPKKKILFASKNNKAVDVVETRVNNLGKHPVLLRMGSSEYNTTLAQYLINLLTTTSSEQEQEDFKIDKQLYKELEEKYLDIIEKEKELIKLRNKTDELDQKIGKIKNDISIDVFERLKGANQDNFQKAINRIKEKVVESNKNKQNILTKLFWSFVKNNRYKNLKKEFSDFKLQASKMDIEVPIINLENIDFEKIDNFCKKLDTYLYYSQIIQNYYSSLYDLKNADSLEKITKEKIDLMNEMSINAENLWKGWLKYQPTKLSNEDRNMLSNYNSMLKMVIDAGSDLYKKLGIRLYKEYLNLSKKISHLLPAWAITSLSARGRIPFDAGYFDIVIFDEASQCDTASALPLLFRAKQAVIIGDPKQLRHISGLRKGQDQQLLEKHSLIPEYAKWAYSYNSLFDLASSFISQNEIINLKDHHRSHADIIEFSNQEFYKGNLRVATNYDSLNIPKYENNGIRWVDVIGKVNRPSTGGAVNEIEARAVVDEIKKLIYERDYKGSIGAVTPFRAQANLINKLINNNPELQEKLAEHDFLVDTVHKFQGDERDLMIFSTVVSENMPKGALNFMKNNGNLFNVAITRARAMLLVVGDQNATINCSVSYLENFAKYTQELEKHKKENISHTIKDLGEEYPEVAQPEKVSDWEHVLYKALYKAGIKAIPQYEVEKYNLDFAVFNYNRRLDVEVDGERYHKDWTGEHCKRDQIRNQRLFELGWDVKRFWVYEIRDNIDECVKQIEEWINK